MFSTTTQMAAQIPSSFGMPVYGPALVTIPGIDVCAVAAATTAVSVVRERKATAVAGATGHAWGTFAGTTAWRPPTC